MDRAVRSWIAREAPRHRGLIRVGYFGSYARGNWGVGSDLDLVAVVETEETPFQRRGNSWNLAGLPVPAEILVYTDKEWRRLHAEGGRFARTIENETVWVFSTNGPAQHHAPAAS